MTGFAVFDFKNGSIRAVRPLDQSELDRYRQAIVHLREFHRARKLIEMIERNSRELREAFSAAEQRLGQSNVLSDVREEIELEVNRRLLNYLTAMRLFLDQTETRLKRRYGQDSSEVRAFLDRCKKAFDSKFGYRFLYKLRNFGQHQALPIGHVKVSSSLDPQTGQVSKTLEVSFDTSELLEQGKDVWGPVQAELRSAPPLLDVRPLVEEASEELRQIENTIMACERRALTASATVLESTLKSVLDAGGIPAVARATERPPKTDLEVILAPKEVLEWLGFRSLAIEL